MGLNQVIDKIPKTILVGGILILALGFFIYSDPLRDECEVQAKIFEKTTQGILSPTKVQGKAQFRQVTLACREGNSPGACREYLNGLKMTNDALINMSEKCQLKYADGATENVQILAQALQIFALLAWGEKPPEGLTNRMGWLSESNVKTFCGIKRAYQLMAGEEKFLELREKVYKQFPAAWPDKAPADGRNPEERPKAYKSAANPEGPLTKEQVYERSLFSIRCDLYL